MSTRNRLLTVAVLIGIAGSASGDGLNNPSSNGGTNSVGSSDGINSLGVGGTAGPTTPCTALELDFSDTTGCNAVAIPLLLR